MWHRRRRDSRERPSAISCEACFSPPVFAGGKQEGRSKAPPRSNTPSTHQSSADSSMAERRHCPILDQWIRHPISSQEAWLNEEGMRSSHWSLQDAKNSFSAVVAAAQKGIPQTVTKRGKPAAVVLSIAEYQRLSQRESGTAPSFVEHLLGMPQDDSTFERSRARPRGVDL
jgi:antitoxin Phd